MESNRRGFLEQVGQGVLLASIGSTLTEELGLGFADAADVQTRLNFGKREALAELLQTTAPEKLLPIVVERINKGTTLRDLIGAAALANARNFGGEDYIGFHTFMAMAPAYAMSRELPDALAALPVLKVLYRNSSRNAKRGGEEVLHPVTPAKLGKDEATGELLRKAVHKQDLKTAEQTFAAIAHGTAETAYNQLLETVEDEADVHRVVLAYRAYDMLNLVGKEHAEVMLRQSVHYCVKAEGWRRGKPSAPRTLLPVLLEKHKLLSKSPGKRKLDDAGVQRLSQNIFRSSAAQAAGLVAEALADGISPDDIGEAISLATIELLLRDNGRPAGQAQAEKPIGSVHGDSIGVHACDSSNAWRNIARVSAWRHTAACLILAGYQAARDRTDRGGDFQRWEPYPRKEHLEKVRARDGAGLLREAEAAIKDKNQAGAAAAVYRYVEQGHPDRDAFALLLRYAISQDGALHAEKFYHTAKQEYGRTRKAFRGRYLTGLARVTASAYGYPAPGYDESRKLIKV